MKKPPERGGFVLVHSTNAPAFVVVNLSEEIFWRVAPSDNVDEVAVGVLKDREALSAGRAAEQAVREFPRHERALVAGPGLETHGISYDVVRVQLVGLSAFRTGDKVCSENRTAIGLESSERFFMRILHVGKIDREGMQLL